jgi:hypothetical protein
MRALFLRGIGKSRIEKRNSSPEIQVMQEELLRGITDFYFQAPRYRYFHVRF